ncbi:histidinol dehydrogenase [Bowmanella sp. JS7-9]|uniref:Histidinol dehydrogenase n=1 Tax=Pseudobowmanella zhangzhouensis TaxID=1537679 RepID=A0ABW1XJA4_9ALTE|nr:histidinol dehydrogenase [Bowmanella sp. JS7-9]TBX25779.1 histidinol dehydrogenase [Bowmanella sp. JS7-9]
MLRWNSLTATQQQAALARPALAEEQALRDTVAGILRNVEQNGDVTLKALTARFEGVTLDSLALPQSELDSAEAELRSEVKQAIELAYDNIRAFHSAQMPQDIRVETRPGVVCELKHAPLDAVGLYIPGGTAPLPSTVLMLGTTAQVAGCARKVLCTPVGNNGRIAAEIRYAAKLCGISEIYLVGGAQAIAAMAFGTESIAKVDKIFGPGNSYVTEAKQQVSQRADGAAIDMPAGPSEVLVLADSGANPVFVAADLLSQAEHGSDSQAILVCNSEALIAQVKAEVDKQLATLSRREIAAQSMANSRYILTDSLQESIAVSNAYAPEHLIVQTRDARSLLGQLKNAGSVFLGAWSPESAGDYASGTNHVLPTYGYAKNYSSLGLMDFMRRYTVQELTEQGLKNIGPAIMALANAEGLDAHLQAVAKRMEMLK